jgi:hypothetical protein
MPFCSSPLPMDAERREGVGATTRNARARNGHAKMRHSGHRMREA